MCVGLIERFIIATIAAALSGAAAAADDAPICADRPGKSSQACTVPAGHFQFESSFADWTLSKGGGERDTVLAIAETGFKFGLTDRSHIDIDLTPWVRTTSRQGDARDRASGFGDMLVSYKNRLTAADAALLIAVSPFVKLPTARHSIGNGKWEGGFIVPIQYAIPRSPLALSLTPEIDWAADGDGSGHHAAMAQVVNLGWQVTDKLNLSGEVWGQWDWDPAGTTRQASADGAVAYLVHSDLQLDAGFNIGLNRVTPDVELYAGIAEQF
ncbi:transporter [Sphingomonas sp. URHD0057]|uniref:transporter n=1 Tax=Sphingomonas sp. URHD0057 TaxID=1380389 RepID=UPI00055B33AD|nr:transporter [Sphingomonas sp. URHD0057]